MIIFLLFYPSIFNIDGSCRQVVLVVNSSSAEHLRLHLNSFKFGHCFDRLDNVVDAKPHSIVKTVVISSTENFMTLSISTWRRNLGEIDFHSTKSDPHFCSDLNLWSLFSQYYFSCRKFSSFSLFLSMIVLSSFQQC